MESFMLSFFGFFAAIQQMILGLTHEDIGYISTICLGVCSLPLFIKTIRDGHCRGVSGIFIVLWFIGDCTGIFYVYSLGKLPLILNYSFNTIMATTILIFKIRKG